MSKVTRRGFWTATGLLVTVFLCAIAARVSEIDAHARQQGTYCWGTGRRYNVHGQQVCEAQWSDDGVHWQTWEER